MTFLVEYVPARISSRLFFIEDIWLLPRIMVEQKTIPDSLATDPKNRKIDLLVIKLVNGAKSGLWSLNFAMSVEYSLDPTTTCGPFIFKLFGIKV